LLEPTIIKRMEREYGVLFLEHQTEGELWLSDDCAVRYHPDGVGNLLSDFWTNARRQGMLKYEGDPSERPDRTVVIECKALTNSLWQIGFNGSTGDTLDEYNWQLASMMLDRGLPGLWAVYNKGLPPDADGNREPCEDAGKIYFEYVKTPPVSLEEIQLKASLIRDGVEGDMLLETERPCDSPEHWPCLYLHLRPTSDKDERSILIPDNPDEVNELATRFLTFKGQHEEAERLYKQARDELVRIAGDAGFIQTDKFYIPVVNGASVRVDWNAAGKQLKEAVDKYKKKKKYKYVKGIRRLEM